VSVSAVAEESLAVTIVDNALDTAQQALNWLSAHLAQWWQALGKKWNRDFSSCGIAWHSCGTIYLEFPF